MDALIQFSVTNFRSFGGTAAISMEAPSSTDEAFVRRVPGHASMRLLPVAALFGANASGKSNLLRALDALCRLVRGEKLETVIDPFRLTRVGRESPTGFQLDAIIDDSRVTYVLQCTRREVRAEALYATAPGGPEETVFERELGAEPSLVLGRSLGAEGSAQRQFLALNAEGTPRDRLLLRDLAERSRETPYRVTLLDRLSQWLREGFVAIGPDTVAPGLGGAVDDPARLQSLGETLRGYDTGVRGLRLVRRDGASALDSLMGQAPPHAFYVRRLADDRPPELLELLAEHAGQDAESPPLPIADESDGTFRLLNLLPLLQSQPIGQCVLIDELDRSLHAAAAQRFVRDFLASRPADQLLFSTHDTSLLDMPELPPACVWFVEKDAAGCSNLHALSDVKPTQLARLVGHFSAAYLQGRFGGVPHWRRAPSGE